MASFNVFLLVVLGLIAVVNANPIPEPEPEPEPALLLADGYRPAGYAPYVEDIDLGLYKPRRGGSHYRSKHPVIDPGYFDYSRYYDNGFFPGSGLYANRPVVY